MHTASAEPLHLPPLEARLERALESVLERVIRVPEPARPWAEALREVCSRPGKRIRPRLCALAYEGVAREPATDGVLQFAAGLELLHAFMLVHDDLVDGAELRRGAPALHKRLGDGESGRALALIGGDALFAASIEAMLRADLPAERAREAQAAVLEGARQAAIGESLDLSYAASALESLSSARLADVLRLKTAGYTFVAPLVSGAILAGAPTQTRRALAHFGQRVGLAFQLADDLLDLYGSEAELGKPIGGDLREGKRTVFVRLLHARAASHDARRLLALLDARAASADDVAWVRELGLRTGVTAELVERIRTAIRAAERSLARARLSEEVTNQLRSLARKVARSVEVMS